MQKKSLNTPVTAPGTNVADIITANAAATNATMAVTTKSAILTTKPPARGRSGRPTIRTPERAKILYDAVARGLPYVHACAVAKICVQSFCVWRRRDAAFRQALDAATALGVQRRLKKIEDAANGGDWRAAAWMLEHCQPDHFARNRVEISGLHGAPIAGVVAVYLPHKDVEPAAEVHAITEHIEVNGSEDEN